jgi:hypothetical protein
MVRTGYVPLGGAVQKLESCEEITRSRVFEKATLDYVIQGRLIWMFRWVEHLRSLQAINGSMQHVFRPSYDRLRFI